MAAKKSHAAAAAPAKPAAGVHTFADPGPGVLHDNGQAVIGALVALCNDHRAHLDLIDAAKFVPGAVVSVRAHHPASIERFVTAARACAFVRKVEVQSTGIELTVAVPAAEG